MKYIVMECHPSYVVLLDEEGRFLKAANLHYETGQTIDNPVLMRETPPRRRRMRHIAVSSFAAVAACFFMLIGLRYYQGSLAAYSSIYLSINPEIQMDLNKQGEVIRLAGINEDGSALLEGYDGKGKDKTTVADELIDRAIDMGFLSEGGQVSFSIDAPDEALVQAYGAELTDEVSRHLEGRFTITVEIVNYQTGQTENTQKTKAPAETPETPAPAETQETPAPAAPAPSTPDPGGASDYDDTDYGPNNDGVTDYNDTDYGPNNDGVTDYNDTDYGPNNDGVTDYSDTDYGDSSYDDDGGSGYEDQDDEGDDDDD